jgi:hypothetical protein
MYSIESTSCGMIYIEVHITTCTASGRLIIIHNLDLTTMAQNLSSFKETWISLILASGLVMYELNSCLLCWMILTVRSLST